MAVIVTLEIPGGTQEQYERTNDRITHASWFPPPGFIAHAAGPDGTGGWRVVDLWESEEAFRAFVEKATPIFQETGMPPVLPRIDPLTNVVVK
ncbi:MULTISPECIES: antibiotic biosynthesis monooxygenase [unclassified Streptomyces]|uniref:antibiotic biosynthesis monooxygenase family protein n=1 Tax=unclassified Streptomyces TaxID=2593676 RepID=UPI002E35556F|nr:antibiotic biosynthesis monooxygenase [Streptomyces sp. NBC_01268]